MKFLKPAEHIFVSGTTGYGKDVLCEFICELMYLQEGYKIIDLQNNKVIEGLGFLRPTQNPKFKAFFNKYGFNGKKHPKLGVPMQPMGFPTKIYHPITPDLPKELPSCFELYSLPLDFFAEEDVLKVITNNEMSDAAVTNLTTEIDKIKTFESFPAVGIKIMESVDKKILKTKGLQDVILFFWAADTKKSASSANRPLIKFREQGIFSSQKFKHCLTNKKLEQIIQNQKEISVFSTAFIPNKFYKLKLAINLYLLYKIIEVNRELRQDLLGYIREGRELFPSARKSDKALKHLAEKSEDTIRDCEKQGLRLLLNSQDPTDVSDQFLTQCSTRYIFRHNLKTQKLHEFFGDMEGMERGRIDNIKKLRKYRYYVSEEGMRIHQNPFRGMKVMYKFSDHLRGRFELNYLGEIFPKKDWFKVKPFIDALVEDHKKSSLKHQEKLLKRTKQEDLAGKLRQHGILMSDWRVLRSLYESYKGGEVGLRYSEMGNRTGMATGTMDGVLKRLNVKNLVFKDEDLYRLTERGIKFIEDNKELFTEEI